MVRRAYTAPYACTHHAVVQQTLYRALCPPGPVDARLVSAGPRHIRRRLRVAPVRRCECAGRPLPALGTRTAHAARRRLRTCLCVHAVCACCVYACCVWCTCSRHARALAVCMRRARPAGAPPNRFPTVEEMTFLRGVAAHVCAVPAESPKVLHLKNHVNGTSRNYLGFTSGFQEISPASLYHVHSSTA